MVAKYTTFTFANTHTHILSAINFPDHDFVCDITSANASCIVVQFLFSSISIFLTNVCECRKKLNNINICICMKNRVKNWHSTHALIESGEICCLLFPASCIWNETHLTGYIKWIYLDKIRVNFWAKMVFDFKKKKKEKKIAIGIQMPTLKLYSKCDTIFLFFLFFLFMFLFSSDKLSKRWTN